MHILKIIETFASVIKSFNGKQNYAHTFIFLTYLSANYYVLINLFNNKEIFLNYIRSNFDFQTTVIFT